MEKNNEKSKLFNELKKKINTMDEDIKNSVNNESKVSVIDKIKEWVNKNPQILYVKEAFEFIKKDYSVNSNTVLTKAHGYEDKLLIKHEFAKFESSKLYNDRKKNKLFNFYWRLKLLKRNITTNVYGWYESINKSVKLFLKKRKARKLFKHYRCEFDSSKHYNKYFDRLVKSFEKS